MIDAVAAMPQALDVGSLLPALSAKVNANANIDRAAQDFEAMFATQLLQPMFETIKVNSEFGGGHGEEVMRSFMVQEYGKMIAKSGRLGIAASVKSEMIRAQEAARARGGATNLAMANTAYASTVDTGGSYVAHR